jgi:hypothetical protein
MNPNVGIYSKGDEQINQKIDEIKSNYKSL